MNWPVFGLSWLPWARLGHAMHELPACLLFAWLYIDSSLQITQHSTSTSTSMSTNNLLQCHALLPPDKPDEGWGQKPSPSFPQLKPFPPSHLLIPRVLLLFVLLSILLPFSPSLLPPALTLPGHTCLCFPPPHQVYYNSTYVTNTSDRGRISQHSLSIK